MLSSCPPLLRDHSLFFDDDSRLSMVFEGGRITLIELQPDLSGIKPDDVNQVIVENVNALFGATRASSRARARSP